MRVFKFLLCLSVFACQFLRTCLLDNPEPQIPRYKRAPTLRFNLLLLSLTIPMDLPFLGPCPPPPPLREEFMDPSLGIYRPACIHHTLSIVI